MLFEHDHIIHMVKYTNCKESGRTELHILCIFGVFLTSFKVLCRGEWCKRRGGEGEKGEGRGGGKGGKGREGEGREGKGRGGREKEREEKGGEERKGETGGVSIMSQVENQNPSHIKFWAIWRDYMTVYKYYLSIPHMSLYSAPPTEMFTRL